MENEIEVNGKKYVLKSSIKQQNILPINKKGLRYCVVRSYTSGVFIGDVGKIENRQATVYNARRLWYWDGANSLSQLAMEGVTKPQNCKFPVALPEVILTDICEVIPATEVCKKSIDGVKIWSV